MKMQLNLKMYLYAYSEEWLCFFLYFQILFVTLISENNFMLMSEVPQRSEL